MRIQFGDAARFSLRSGCSIGLDRVQLRLRVLRNELNGRRRKHRSCGRGGPWEWSDDGRRITYQHLVWRRSSIDRVHDEHIGRHGIGVEQQRIEHDRVLHIEHQCIDDLEHDCVFDIEHERINELEQCEQRLRRSLIHAAQSMRRVHRRLSNIPDH
jgi:hypothetical protein